MKLTLYQVDAFSDKVFAGNPAAVCPLDNWLTDEQMQAIAMENNLSETAFFVATGVGEYQLRWFTPLAEVKFCGHATLATAHVLFHELGVEGALLRFRTLNGELKVARDEKGMLLDFPVNTLRSAAAPSGMTEALGVDILEAWHDGDDFLLRLADQKAVLGARPNFNALLDISEIKRGVIITAEGEEVDFVSRMFGPKVGINEDPVTGSAHCSLTPFWAEKLGKQALMARQLSQRGGEIFCRLSGERVLLTGQAVTYLRGEIEIPG